MIFRSDNDSITVKVHDPFPHLNSSKIQSKLRDLLSTSTQKINSGGHR
jgi:hypothetical protein